MYVLEAPTVPLTKLILIAHSINKLAVQLECHTQGGKAVKTQRDVFNFLQKHWMENDPNRLREIYQVLAKTKLMTCVKHTKMLAIKMITLFVDSPNLGNSQGHFCSV